MGVSLVHNFETEVSTVQDVSPGVDNMSLSIKERLVEVETIEVECHGANTKSSEPDTDNRPCCEEEVQRTGVVEGGVLEDEATEVTVSGYNVVGLFFLSELVTVVLGFVLSRFTNERRSNQTSVHSTKEAATEYPSHTEHVERMHENVVFCLEDEHVVKRARDSERHCIREGTLTERIDKEHCRSSGNRSRISNADPRTHPQTVREFPFTAHISVDTNQEVEDNKLERPTIVQPLIQGSSFPDGIKVQSNCVGRRNDSTRNDVVAPHKRTRNRFTNTINVHRGSTDESDDETSSSCKQGRNHQNTKPTNIEAVIGRSYPLAELFPSIRLFLT